MQIKKEKDSYHSPKMVKKTHYYMFNWSNLTIVFNFQYHLVHVLCLYDEEMILNIILLIINYGYSDYIFDIAKIFYFILHK